MSAGFLYDRIMEKFSHLGGRWSGTYDYPDNEAETTPFQARITDTTGQLSGEIFEPNTFGITSSFVITATLDGSRSGSHVEFIKEYVDNGDIPYFIRYAGTVNEALTQIEGTWTTIEDGYSWSGPFIMTRLSGPPADAEVEDNVDMVVR